MKLVMEKNLKTDVIKLEGGGDKRRERELIWQVIIECLAVVTKETAVPCVEGCCNPRILRHYFWI